MQIPQWDTQSEKHLKTLSEIKIQPLTPQTCRGIKTFTYKPIIAQFNNNNTIPKKVKSELILKHIRDKDSVQWMT